MLTGLAEKTRSYRRFEEERRVDPGTLRELVNLARLAPCAANLQVLRFSMVTAKEACAGIFRTLRWAGYLEDWDGPEEGERPAAYILVHSPQQEAPYTGIDVGIAAAYMVLGAMERELGACMLLSFDREALAGAAGPPSGYATRLVIALGSPGERILLETVGKDGNIRYWRDDDGVHHVPKRPLDDLIASNDIR
ncbi:nitroreductase family protein [Candidatus Fermentibacterales bacterium]|nr:nitroreductase family protein [Candidatus Fermentibacterales bacterium]